MAVLLPVWLATGAAILGSLSVLSRLVTIEREQFPDAWEADGRPPAPWTVPWRLPPRGDPSMPGSPFHLLRTNRLVAKWILVTPSWARGHADARKLLWLLRALQVAALAGVAAWFVLLLPHVGRR